VPGVGHHRRVNDGAATPPPSNPAAGCWIDTHNHLDAAEFDRDREASIARARSAGVSMLVVPAVEVTNFDTVRKLAHAHGLAYALGIHPMAVGRSHDADIERLREALAAHRSDPRLVAVGEIGIDGFEPAGMTPEAMARQQHFFRAQLEAAREFALPVIMHVRRAVDAVLAGLRRVDVPGGIAHAFNGSHVQARALVDRGLRLGFGGAMTFERALQLRRLAAELPAHAIVLETDAPDIPPQWLYRTRRARDAGAAVRNEAAELPRIALTLAELRKASPLEIAALTTHNACAALPRLSALMLQTPETIRTRR
jgi:TatD DNase family protein